MFYGKSFLFASSLLLLSGCLTSSSESYKEMPIKEFATGLANMGSILFPNRFLRDTTKANYQEYYGVTYHETLSGLKSRAKKYCRAKGGVSDEISYVKLHKATQVVMDRSVFRCLRNRDYLFAVDFWDIPPMYGVAQRVPEFYFYVPLKGADQKAYMDEVNKTVGRNVFVSWEENKALLYAEQKDGEFWKRVYEAK
jgi:hypothetical protein